jgi:4-carboxymuconolactone decarboxylase
MSLQPRITPIMPPYDADTDAMLKKWMPPDSSVEPLILFRVMARHPDLMSRMRPLGAAILGSTTLAPAEREILINRTCARCGCEYEWGVHVTGFGQAVGLSAETLAATATAPSDDPIWSERERLLIRLVDCLHETAAIPDDLWEGLADHWNEQQIIEMIVIVGWYHTISYLANGISLPREGWAARFP